MTIMMDSTTENMSPAKQPLSERSTNTHLQTNSASEIPPKTNNNEAELKAATSNSMEYHRHVLKEKLDEGQVKSPGNYISPSDGIMSPCTKKLSDLKGKKFKNAGKPQALFAKALGQKSYETMSREKSASDDSSGTKDEENKQT